MSERSVIIRPIITEKTMQDAAKGRYTFVVMEQAGKKIIRQAVEKQFNVTVVAITTRTTKGRTVRAGKMRREMKKPVIKKAAVQVAKDQKISLFETGGAAE